MNRNGFNVDATVKDGCLCARLIGELDLASVPQLRQAVEPDDASIRDVVFDAGALEFIDVVGLNALIDVCARNRRRGRRVRVIHPPSPLRRLAHFAGVEEFLALPNQQDSTPLQRERSYRATL